MASQRRQTFEAETYPDPFARGGRVTAHLGDQRAQRGNNFEMRSNTMFARIGPMEPNAFQRNGCQCWTDGLVKRKLF